MCPWLAEHLGGILQPLCQTKWQKQNHFRNSFCLISDGTTIFGEDTTIFDNTVPTSGGKKLTAKEVFKLVSGQVFLQYLKTKERNVYNHIVNDLESTWSAAEIALKAMSYSAKLNSKF